MKFFHPSLLLLGLFVIGGIAFKLTTPNDCDFILPNDSIFVLTDNTKRSSPLLSAKAPFKNFVSPTLINGDVYTWYKADSMPRIRTTCNNQLYC